MTGPRETANLAAAHATVDAALTVLASLESANGAIDPQTGADLATARASLRRVRERIYHEVRRDLDVLERHELELDESRDRAES